MLSKSNSRPIGSPRAARMLVLSVLPAADRQVFGRALRPDGSLGAKVRLSYGDALNRLRQGCARIGDNMDRAFREALPQPKQPASMVICTGNPAPRKSDRTSPALTMRPRQETVLVPPNPPAPVLCPAVPEVLPRPSSIDRSKVLAELRSTWKIRAATLKTQALASKAPESYSLEKVVRHRGVGRRMAFFVKYEGYSDWSWQPLHNFVRKGEINCVLLAYLRSNSLFKRAKLRESAYADCE